MTSEAVVLGEPMFVNSDGLLYVVKQTGIEPRELTKDEEIIFGGKVKAVIRPTRGRVVFNANNTQKKEKGITIKVVEKKEEIKKKD